MVAAVIFVHFSRTLTSEVEIKFRAHQKLAIPIIIKVLFEMYRVPQKKIPLVKVGHGKYYC